MNYLAYHFEVEPREPGSEILIALLSDFPFDSFEDSEKGFVAYIPEDKSENLNFNFDLEEISYTYKIEKVEQINWNEEWEKNFEPVLIENKLLIRAPFHLPNKNVKHEIIIMPKMSFGTGHHQTTKLICTKMLEENFIGKTVLDVGCGTGILGILALKLGASEVTGTDIDDWCVENSIENCAMNNCQEIKIIKGFISELKFENKFDYIIANINKNVLLKEIEIYSSIMKRNSKLLLSGFFTTDVKELTECALQYGLDFVSTQNENEWAMVEMVKK